MTTQARYRFGFDIGGTFTDFVLWDVEKGALLTYKTLTTPDDPTRAVIEGWHALLNHVGAEGRTVELSIHGTTLITNALIERRGARTALITTAGFADTLDTQREMRYDIYDLHSPPVPPLVPPELRCEVDERLNAFGEVVVPLGDEALAALTTFVEQTDPQALAICLLHAYRNDAHEQGIAAALRGRFPQLALSLSAEVAPEIREYERMSTTVANAYVQPLAERYLLDLDNVLRQLGSPRELYLMLSSGGISTANTAARFPIRLVESGPAAGALAACFFGRMIGHSNLVAFDMGGTTAKLCVITEGQPVMTTTFEIARMHRFKRGSGLPVRIPAIELIEIGAGGGSIAYRDDLGLLKVGPRSAGALPGPACYGRGGTLPTVTDANLLLGYLDPANFLGGRMRLDVEAARAAVEPLAAALELSVDATAYGIHRVVTESMIAATRVHVAERGVDPRRVWLMAFGGAGPAHADEIARALKMPGYIVPSQAGVASALGFLAAPIAFDLARTYPSPVNSDTLPLLEQVLRSLADEGRTTLAEAGVAPQAMHFMARLDLRHVGQGHEITVTLPSLELVALGLEQVRNVFFAQYEAIYGYAHRHLHLEVMTCRLTATGGTPDLQLERMALPAEPTEAVKSGMRRLYVAGWSRFADVPIYQRELLGGGDYFAGPAVVEEAEATTVVGPNTTVTVDAYRNLVIAFIDNDR